MSRYKYTKLRNLGSVHGFLIHTPDDRKLLDIYPIGIVHELNRLNDRINKLEEQLMEVKNEHAVLVADVVIRDDKIERIKQLEEENDAMRADLLLWKDWVEEERRKQ